MQDVITPPSINVKASSNFYYPLTKEEYLFREDFSMRIQSKQIYLWLQTILNDKKYNRLLLVSSDNKFVVSIILQAHAFFKSVTVDVHSFLRVKCTDTTLA